MELINVTLTENVFVTLVLLKLKEFVGNAHLMLNLIKREMLVFVKIILKKRMDNVLNFLNVPKMPNSIMMLVDAILAII